MIWRSNKSRNYLPTLLWLYLNGICSSSLTPVTFISTSFLTTSRRLLQFSSPTGSAAGGTSEEPSSPPSPRGMSSQSSSNLPSPVGASSKPGNQTWSLDTDLSSSRAATLMLAPSPTALQDTSSQDTQSSGKILTHLCVHCRSASVVKRDISDLHIFLFLYYLWGCDLIFFFLAAHNGDSVIIVNEQKGKKRGSSRLVFFSHFCYFLVLFSSFIFF